MRARSLFVCIAVATALVACSDPGSGGGVVVDADATSGDGALFDVPSGDAGSCVNGTRQCDGQVAQQCVNGTFTDLFECPSSQTCENGACKQGGDTSVTPDAGDTTETVEPDPCQAKECGPDGLGGSCGTCQLPESCNPQGQCVAGCVPSCNGKECGSDTCGGSCGECGADEQCVQGSCELTEVCDCGAAECGVDNCGNSCGTCGVDESCEAGVCVTGPVDGGSCTDLIDCIYADTTGCFDASADDTEFQTCVDACYGASNAIGASEFDAYLGCLQACPQPDDDPATTDDDLAYDRCSYSNCSDDEARCVFDKAGSGTCFEIFDCFDLCAEGDGACYEACWEAATEAAQIALWSLDNCLTVECPDAADQACVDAAIADQCADFVLACQTN